jgi:hypothetical protein
MTIDPAELRRTLVYQGSKGLDEMIQDISVIESMDKVAEGRIKTGRTIGCIGLVVLFGSFFLVAFTEQPALLVVSAIGVIGAIVGFVFAGINKRGDIDDRRYEMLRQLCPMLARDMGPDPSFELLVDLNQADQKHKFTHKGKAGTWNVKYYRDPWLELKGRFVDGTRFTLNAVDLLQRRSKWKTNARGKRKHKTKLKHGAEFQLQLGYKPGKYGATAVLVEEAAEGIELPSMVLKKLDIGPGRLLIKAGQKGIYWDGREPKIGSANGGSGSHLASMLFFSAYRILGLGRQLTKEGVSA